MTFIYRTYKAGGVLLMIASFIGSIVGLTLLFGPTLFGFTLRLLGIGGLAAVSGVVMLVFR